MFIISQMINLKYYFDDCLPVDNKNLISFFDKEFINELILYAKVIVVYAILGLILSCYFLRKN